MTRSYARAETDDWYGRVDFEDLQGERRYGRWRAYGQSKVANLLFALELDRWLRLAGWRVQSLAAHPGYAATKLQSTGPTGIDSAIMAVTNRLVAQSAEMGALRTLYPARARALDEALARRLWTVSEQLTGVRFALAEAAA